MNTKMATNSQLSTPDYILKKKETKQQLEQEQNHGYADHLEGYQLGGGEGGMGKKAQGLRNIICRYKIDRGRLRIV